MNFIEFLERDEAKERILERKKLTPTVREEIIKLQNQGNTEPLKGVALRKRKSEKEDDNDFVTPRKGLEYLKRNRMVRCMLYDTTTIINDLLFNHLKTKNKRENQARLELAKFVVNTLKFPQEIWLQPISGRLNFIKQFSTTQDGKQISLLLVVVVTKDKQLLTFYDYVNDLASANEHRWGKLLYKS